MLISKILNNNVVISEEDQEEVILMGRGLAFGRKVGQEIPDELIEKRYVLSENRRQLLMELPAEVMEMSDKIISFAREKLQKKLKDTAFLAMADHIHGVLLRLEDDIYLKNFLMWDIKRFFPIEFEVGQFAKQLLSAYIGKELPDDEAAFMALTLVNAELENGDGTARDLTMMMEEIMTIVKYSLEISLDEEDVYLERFMTHLKFFCERVLTDSSNRDLEDNDMFDLLKCKYPLAYETTRKIAEFLKQTRNYQTSEDEQLYLTIHLSRMKRRMTCKANTKK
ncbi:PRD domain-containing protein [Streptococcus sanguinis]|uniref:BglG family transcriptional antiterminator n=1 Tax=Streptococcus sanguinis TaxID=1305 RepID=A0A2X3VMY4_STRSA|nr:PRD domain-containing protein [Streptococcus sanguinis]EGJ44624.1 transcription antiterminator LicT [Streptococcus sanguinis SK1059]EGQ20972.1 transcription antiterminator LicT [Streptococcus sanguinis ATCC 29667]EGQ24528.1 transcription antiterminator LicT [Streptococcus sanguinis SK340]SQF34797.1 BglG family transcriptional antiterminator [Streptococcus sanguinis]